jgi:phosphoribosylcarboxyaminoimidazole (NCAIR) mutase
MVQDIPDCVVIAIAGPSEGAGPTLAAATTVPVIVLPSAKDTPDAVSSSLRTGPAMMVMEPSNAVLAALRILSARNPKLYMRLRGDSENSVSR